ncbi:MAG: gamma carbonic anhydrase family protein [Bacteriovoracaceae bacterium]|nr:gamma carbonic anhydrase family protein [Bacteriovoracaceae bacterium]
MTILQYDGHTPRVSDGCFIAPSADLIGDIIIGKSASVWFNCVLRGDMAQISIGENTNIQDLSMLHVDTNGPLIIGNNVTVGHKATLHACHIGDNCLIGMGAIILNNAKIGANSLVAAGSLVPPGKQYPPGSYILGTPAKVHRPLTKEEKTKYGNHYFNYLKLAKSYL